MKIEVKLYKNPRMFQLLKSKLQNVGEVLLEAVEYLIKRARERIDEGGDPPWEPVKYPWATGGRTGKRDLPRNYPHPILFWKGVLYDSFQARLIKGGQQPVAEVYTDVPYAPWLNYGSSKVGLPARRFLYADAADATHIKTMIDNFLKENASGSK